MDALLVLQDQIAETKKRRVLGEPILHPALGQLRVPLEDDSIRFYVSHGSLLSTGSEAFAKRSAPWRPAVKANGRPFRCVSRVSLTRGRSTGSNGVPCTPLWIGPSVRTGRASC